LRKIRKKQKNFAKGYLQTGIYVVNYGKFKMGREWYKAQGRYFVLLFCDIDKF
jgi:hypothetical protein